MSHFYAGAIDLVLASKRIETLLLGARRPVACTHELVVVASCATPLDGLARSQTVKNAQDDAILLKPEYMRWSDDQKLRKNVNASRPV